MGFHPLDLVLYGLTGISIAGFLAALLRHQGAPAIAVTAACALGFLAACVGLYVLRLKAKAADARTARGLRLYFGKLNRPPLDMILEWESALVVGWAAANDKRMPDTLVRQTLDGLAVRFLDEPKFSLWGRWMAGAYFDGACLISYHATSGKPDWETVRALFVEELSHALMEAAGTFGTEAMQHATLKQYGIR